MSLAARKIRLIMALRRSGVTDTNVLAAIERIPREDFVPESFHDQAYEDKALPIGQGQTISSCTCWIRGVQPETASSTVRQNGRGSRDSQSLA